MKRKAVVIFLSLFLSATLIPFNSAQAFPILAIIQAAVKKVIKAVDLAIQRIQTKTIKLQNLQKQLENQLSKLKLDEIGSWAQKQKDLYKEYFDELAHVKALLMSYEKVKAIIVNQKNVLLEYGYTVKRIRSDKNFTEKDVTYMLEVCSNILDESIKNVEELTLVVNSFKTTMTDAERLVIIDRSDKGVQNNLNDIRAFNHNAFMLSLQKSQDASQIEAVKKLYGIQ